MTDIFDLSFLSQPTIDEVSKDLFDSRSSAELHVFVGEELASTQKSKMKEIEKRMNIVSKKLKETNERIFELKADIENAKKDIKRMKLRKKVYKRRVDLRKAVKDVEAVVGDVMKRNMSEARERVRYLKKKRESLLVIRERLIEMEPILKDALFECMDGIQGSRAHAKKYKNAIESKKRKDHLWYLNLKNEYLVK